MAQKSEIQAQIDEIVTGANYRANQMRPMLTDILDYASAGQTPVFTGLVANGTTASTTLVLNVGVNIIGTATTTNYACKLPQPVTGQRVTVVNRSLMSILVYPSNVGGQINNLPVNTPLLIPPDRKTYDFICIENPLPGAWSVTPPATNQYDSGEISFTTTGDTSGYKILFSALSGTIYSAEVSGNTATSIYVINALNWPNQNQSTPGSYPNTNYSTSLRPPNIWNAITRVKVYTNIIPALGVNPSLVFGFGEAINKYQAGTTTFDSNLDHNSYVAAISRNLNQTINNIPPSSPASLSTNVGDAGTAYRISDIAPNSYTSDNIYPSIVGDLFLSTDGTYDTWFSRDIYMALTPRIIGTVKFRVFIEYN